MSARSDDLQASNRLSVSSSLKLTCIFLNRSPARASYVASADLPADADDVDESCAHGSSLISTDLDPSAVPLCEQIGV